MSFVVQDKLSEKIILYDFIGFFNRKPGLQTVGMDLKIYLRLPGRRLEQADTFACIMGNVVSSIFGARGFKNSFKNWFLVTH